MAGQGVTDYLPPEVLDRPDFVFACRDRDLGAMFRIASKWGGPGFTASHLARRCEMTVSRVQDYAKGRRSARSVHIFERVSDGLHIPGRMLGIDSRPWEADSQKPSRDTDSYGTRRSEDQHVSRREVIFHAPAATPAIKELCTVVTRYGFSGSFSVPDQLGEAPAIGVLERELKISYEAYQRSRFTMAASRISMLLPDALLAGRDCKAADRARVSRILALSYQAAASVLAKAGESDLAWIVAERGLNAAEVADSTSVQGSLIRSVAFSMLSVGHLESAMRLVESGADYLRSKITKSESVLSVYGTLLLVGSMAAARFGDAPRTAVYLKDAGDAAQWLSKDANHLWTAFGPTNVAIHRVNTAVELGDIGTVLNSGLSLNTDAVPVERRVRYLLDVARVHSLTGNRDDAVTTMLAAERIAPEQVHQHYLGRETVINLLQSKAGRPAIALEKLAVRMKVYESV